MNRLFTALRAFLFWCFLLSAGLAATISVPADQPTIQAGLDSAQTGDTVLVGPGAWLEQMDFSGKAVVLISQAGPSATILQTFHPDSQIVRIASGETAGTEIAGFTFRGGHGNALVLLGGGAEVLIRNNIFEQYAGIDAVVRCEGARVHLIRNVFYRNGGLACIGVYSDTVTILNNTIDQNTAGVFVLAGSGVVRNSIVTNSSQYGLSGDFVLSDYNVVWNNVPNFDAGALSGADDLFADPGFTASGSYDYTLRDTSICIDAGDPDSLYLDPDSSRNDIGALPVGSSLGALPLPIDVTLIGLSLSRVVDSLPLISWRFYDSVGSYSGYELEVGSDNDWVIAEMWAPGQILQSDTIVSYAGAALIDSTTYYLRLRVNNGAVWGDWHTTAFRMNTRPRPPIPQHPVLGDSAHIANVVLTVINGSDWDADALTYEFYIYSDSLLTVPVAADSGVAETFGTTDSRPIDGLAPDSVYWWRARVSDNYERSEWSDTGSFVTYQGPRTIRVPSEEPTIKAAIAAAVSGDTILVADGIYSGPGNRDMSFGSKDLVLLSENGPAVTAIDCGDTLGTLYDGIRITANQDSTTLVRGFTIRNADNAVVLEASPHLQNLTLENSTRGILTYGTLTSTMDSLVVRNNQTGIYSEEYGTLFLTRSHVVANTTGVLVSDGTLYIESSQVDSNITGIEVAHASLFMTDCRLSHNGTGVRSNVGTLFAMAEVIESVFDSNSIAVYGDCRLQASLIRGGQVGIEITFPDHARLDTVTITGVTETALRHVISRRISGPASDEAHTGTPGFYVRQSSIVANPGLAGKIESDQDGDFVVLRLDSTVVASNGGGLVLDGALSMVGSLYAQNGGPLTFSVNKFATGRRRIEACTFTDNDSSAIAILADSAVLELHHTIVADNEGEGVRYVTKDGSQPVLTCNNVYGNLGGDYAGVIDSMAMLGNYSEPPRFCDAPALNYSLYDISVCAAANNACATVIGAFDTACTNTVPAITSPDSSVVTEDSLLVYHILYVDLDGPDTTVQVNGIASWLTLDGDSLYGTPTEGIPDTIFEIVVSDGFSADTQMVVVKVVPVNDAPLLDTVHIPTLVELDTLTLHFTATDIENDSLVLSVEPLPAGASVVDSGNGSAVLVWIVDTLSAGAVNLTFIVADSSLADSQTVFVNVRSRRPLIQGVFVDGLDSNLRVVSHQPEILWLYIDSVFGFPQTAIEIAVGVDTNWDFAEIWNPAPFVTAESMIVLNGAPLSDGETYYLRLRARNDTLYSPWYEESFQMNSQPTRPSATDSGQISSYSVAQPTLVVVNSEDSDGDLLTYEFQIFADSLLDSLVDSVSQIAEQSDSTEWTVGEPLEENETYWWRARSTDTHEFSPWSDSAGFFIDVTPQAPLPFSAVALPVDSGETLYEMLPTFQWQRAVDPDPFDAVAYHMQLASDSLFQNLVVDDTILDTIYVFSDSLAFGGRYWWRLEAIDLSSQTTACATRIFFRTWTLGDINHSNNTNLTDLTRLVNSLFVTFEPIIPYFVGDLDASCTVTLTDITILVNYLFFEGEPLRPGCPPPLEK